MAHFPEEDFCNAFYWKPVTGVAIIKCLHNTLLSLYFNGMVTREAFNAAHATIASDPEHWIALLWDRLRHAQRTLSPKCGDIVLLDNTKHARIFVRGTTARYKFAEYSSKRGWLSLGCSARDWRPTYRHEFVSLRVVRDIAVSELSVPARAYLRMPTPPPKLLVLADFDGRDYGAEYLVLAAGDLVLPMPVPSGVKGEGWMYGRKPHGQPGWYPPEYVANVPVV